MTKPHSRCLQHPGGWTASLWPEMMVWGLSAVSRALKQGYFLTLFINAQKKKNFLLFTVLGVTAVLPPFKQRVVILQRSIQIRNIYIENVYRWNLL